MKKLIALLLVLVMLLSLMPMTAMAAASLEPENTGKPSTKEEADTPAKEDNSKNTDGKARYQIHRRNDTITGYGCDNKYHWWQCSCGCKIGMEPHVDPLDTDDDTCICGYQFSDNADLVTLWVQGCHEIKFFNKNKTEYKLKAHTYRDFQEIQVSTQTFDSGATVELPEDLTLKKGENKFEVKVIAENQKVTKTYTLIITK